MTHEQHRADGGRGEISQEVADRARNDSRLGPPIDERRGDHHEFKRRVADPIEHAVERREAVDKGDLASPGEGPTRVDLLYGAKAPARTLRDIGAETFRSETHA